MSIQIITTSDGSHSLLNTELDETYHSRHGAVQESLHVFIKEGLEYCIQRNSLNTAAVLEIGFGTGLNALLTWQRAEEIPCPVVYTSLETFPVPEEIWCKLNYMDAPGAQERFDQLHRAPWNQRVAMTGKFQLHKVNASLQSVELVSPAFDVVYFDAFAPNKQPEMWELPMLEKVVNMLTPSGIFVTYCAKGQLKRDLKSLGLIVETLPGPPGKKEMVRGVKV
jgi:tRNA U34 5-methylaminomethyl-2-thiouridine-forming methyltransferase MnmC